MVLQASKIVIKSKNAYRNKVLNKCGSEILDELSIIQTLQLSECVITKGYYSNYKYILHTALPKFKSDFILASESSLHFAVRNILDVKFINIKKLQIYI